MDWQRIVREARILIVEDDPAIVRLLEKTLRRVSFERIESTDTSSGAMELLRAFEPDLILLDIHLSGANGLDLLAEISDWVPPRSFLPIMVLTGDASEEVRLQALLLGARDVISKPFDPVETMLRVRCRLETRFLFQELEEENQALRAAATKA